MCLYKTWYLWCVGNVGSSTIVTICAKFGLVGTILVVGYRLEIFVL